MSALGTYSVLLVQPNNRLLHEVVQAKSKADATEQIKAMYPDCKHLETKTKVKSEGEANKEAAAKEAAALKLGKEAQDAAAKRKATKDARKKK